MDLVTSKDHIAANLLLFDSYKSIANPVHHTYFRERFRLGKIYVFTVHKGRYLFCPSRFAGYEGCTAEKHQAFPHKNGTITTPAISRLLGKASKNAEAENALLAFCTNLGIKPSNKVRTYWRMELDPSHTPHRVSAGEPGFPDEVAAYVEGATKRVVVNAYERNREARSACLAHHGYNCAVCDINFGLRYGAIGAGFMHVHHLTPISTVAAQHEIDPVTQMRPVCPNCHAMLHKSDPPFSIEEMKEVLQGGDNANPSLRRMPTTER
jgi:5-methylcytosine-specific restriction enzyme A